MIYTLAFVFDSNNEVALILKNRPINLAGKYNGIGGKVEVDESVATAAFRELKEEADLVPQALVEIGIYKEDDFQINIFYGYVYKLIAKSNTDEPVHIFSYDLTHELKDLDKHARAFLNLAYIYHTSDKNFYFRLSNKTFEDEGFGF